MLGQPGVVLRGPKGQEIDAPTSSDVAGKGDGWFLDYPGNPLVPGCDYEKWFKETSAGISPTLYAHVATDPDHPDKLAMQYWFFYTYNDWNDKHEGDWEMVQVVFPAATPEEALGTQPESVAFAQHEGSQVSPWDSPGLIKEGDHPVVYPGQGSHAAYYTQATWFGKSAAAGFGCDNTTAPGVEVTPDIRVIPAGVPPETGPFAWVSFMGHWGQEEPSFDDGPTGPATKTQWSTPITWQEDEGRSAAVALPPVSGRAIGTFCSLTARGSTFYNRALDAPWLMLGILVLLLVLVGLLVRRTEWRRGSGVPYRRRRAGQVVTGAVGWVRRHSGPVAGISGVIVLVAIVTVLTTTLLLAPEPTADITDVYGDSGGWMASQVALLVPAVLVVLMGWVAAGVISLVRDDAEGRAPSASTALRAALHSPAGIVTAIALLGAALVMSSSLILLPVAALLVSRWAVAPAAAVVEGLPIVSAFRRSAELTKGRRWRALLVQVALLIVGVLIPGLVGASLLLLTTWPFWLSIAISIVLVAMLLPVTFAGMAMQFYDLRHRVSPGVSDPQPVPGRD